MKKYQKKFIWRNFFYSNFVIILLSIAIILVLNGIINLYYKYQVTSDDLNYIRKEESENNLKLNIEQDKLNNINTETGKDKYIRNTYSVKKPDEELIIVYDTASSTYEIPKGQTFLDSIRDFIKNLLGQ